MRLSLPGVTPAARHFSIVLGLAFVLFFVFQAITPPRRLAGKDLSSCLFQLEEGGLIEIEDRFVRLR